jgi:hypothetical protein
LRITLIDQIDHLQANTYDNIGVGLYIYFLPLLDNLARNGLKKTFAGPELRSSHV